MSTKLRLLVAGVAFVLSAPLALAAEPAAPARLINQADLIGISVKQSLVSGAKAGNGPFDVATAEAIEKAYELRGNVPVWVDDNGYNDKAKKVIEELKRAGDWGLLAADYALPNVAGPGLPVAKLTEAELGLTRASLRYARDAHVGSFDPQRISELIDLMSTPPDPAAVLTGLAESTDPAGFLVKFNPRHPEFEWLRQKYLAMRGKQPDPGESRVPDGPRLKPGATGSDVPLIRQRLHVFAPANGDPQLYDEVLAVAVKDYQEAHGLRPDGIVTPAFRRLLNQALQAAPSVTTDVERILANMERWRWLPEDLGSTYVLDNIPEFMTRVVRNGETIHSARIVVGKTDTPTPLFSKNMQYVEFHPFWKIPDSIKVKELLPSIARGGSGALARRGLKIAQNGKEINPSTIDFGSTDIRNYEIFQPPGGANALGEVKFMFPNHYDVYMHDTPSKDLFADNVRAFSHGCIRVQNPQKFAEVIMSEANGWSPERVKEQFANLNNEQVPLEHTIPVHVTYFTVRASADGELQYVDDIYGHDRRTTYAIAGKWGQVQKQLAPKSTNEADLMASIRGSGSDSLFYSGSDSGSFADIFGLSGGDPYSLSKSGRRHRVRVFGGSGNSGFVDVPVIGGGSQFLSNATSRQ